MVLLISGRINKINRQGGPFLFLFLPKKFNGFFFFFFICCQFVKKKGIISWVPPPPLSSPGRTTRILQLSPPPLPSFKYLKDLPRRAQVSLCVCWWNQVATPAYGSGRLVLVVEWLPVVKPHSREVRAWVLISPVQACHLLTLLHRLLTHLKVHQWHRQAHLILQRVRHKVLLVRITVRPVRDSHLRHLAIRLPVQISILPMTLITQHCH